MNKLQRVLQHKQLGLAAAFQPFSKNAEMNKLQQFKNQVEQHQNSYYTRKQTYGQDLTGPFKHSIWPIQGLYSSVGIG